MKENQGTKIIYLCGVARIGEEGGVENWYGVSIFRSLLLAILRIVIVNSLFEQCDRIRIAILFSLVVKFLYFFFFFFFFCDMGNDESFRS